MTTLAGLPYVRIEFKKSGELLTPVAQICPPGTTDLVVVSHGWHQAGVNAEENLYEVLVTNLKAAAHWPANRKVAIAGVFWPSDQFRDDLTFEDSATVGGHATAAGGDVDEPALIERAKEIADFLEIADKDGFVLQARRAANGGGDADKLVDDLRAATAGTDGLDPQTENEHQELLTKDGSVILSDLKLQPQPGAGLGALPQAGTGGAAAVGAGGSGTVGGQALGVKFGAKAGVAKLLNQFAYFELKKRAGNIGKRLGVLLDGAPGLNGVRIHLVGHSFGARLVTAATSTMATRHPASLSLLQGAFSHAGLTVGKNLLGQDVNGAFRDVLDQQKVVGPILITHTWNDKAVGLAYAAASRVSQTVAAAVGVSNNFGGPGDIYGGMGANGALRVPNGKGSDGVAGPATTLVVTRSFVNNLKCDFIANHNDVARPEVARLVAQAMG